ncbi:MAG: endonuclease III domain-containing protein [Planctomycetaceae bacterium]|nr:endonuclease III domain-containing protein [Planctomycetaceae bacterium]
MTNSKLLDIYQRLYDAYGPQFWWPGESTIEIIVGAILTQNTSWSNVEKAIANLKNADCLSPQKLHTIAVEQLGTLIRPAGYYNIKAQRLKNFIHYLFERHSGDLDSLEALSAGTLREQLLAIKGIGPETADSICLYAFNKPIFVVDAYTARIFGRHGLLEPGWGYHQIQDLFHSGLEKDPVLFNEFHALIVHTGKEHCKPKPICKGCPLEELPHCIDEVF